MITTTTDHIEGYRITEYLGVVFADAPDVRLRNRNINEPEAWHMEYDEETPFYIVGSMEANSMKGKISNESPVGKALIGAHVGDVVTVETPAGEVRYKVLKIERNVA